MCSCGGKGCYNCCSKCNYDTHRCPGCGIPLPHGVSVCGPCHMESLEQTEEGKQGIPYDLYEKSPREKVLDEASKLIVGDRNKTYGSPTENFSNIAEIWNTLLRHKLKDDEKISPTEVATLMVAVKLARTIAQPKRDNFVDIAGYAACGWEAHQASEEAM